MNMQGLLALLISAAMSCGAMADTTSVPVDADAALIGSATQTTEVEDAAAAPDTADSAGTADTSDAADTQSAADALDAADTPDALDTAGAADASGSADTSDALGAAGAADASDAADTSDALDVAGAADASDSTAAVAAPSATGLDEAATGVSEARGYSRLFTDNPVPDVAQRCLGSVVGVINLVSSFDFDSREVTDEEYGYGSGVVIDNEGHIVTNAHVVQGADKLRILLDDDTELDAELVGLDSDTDLAVLYVEGLELEPVEIGDSSALRVGDLLIAIGNPGGYYGTVSVGVVSALERDIETFARPMDIIQTDAAMSPGISGGALLNADGELVGIPTLGVMLYEGLNFAIPSNTMREVVDELITYGKVRKPGMGIYYQVQDGPDEPLRSCLPAGLLVVEVGLDTPAEAAGMRVGDVIYEINGTRIKSARELTLATQDCEAGDVISVRVYRHSYQERPVDENFIDMDVTLEYIE